MCFSGIILSLAFFIGGLVYLVNNLSVAQKENITCKVMGLGKRKIKHQSHGILNTASFTSLEDYYKLLRRDTRATFSKISGVFETNKIKVETHSHDQIGIEHLKVIFSHEARIYSMPRALFVSCTRFVSLCVMVGTLDHFYIDGKLVAFSHTVIKGNTLRAMWFYQKQEVSRCLIWFYAVQKSISRAIATNGVNFVDLGPSYNSKVKEAKEKLLFADTVNWNELCDYSGDFSVSKF